MSCNIVEYISYNMGTRDLPDIYAHALGPAALGLGHMRPEGVGIYIRQIPLAHVITYTYVHKYVTNEAHYEFTAKEEQRNAVLAIHFTQLYIYNILLPRWRVAKLIKEY